jgi:hypothetical protein
MGAGAVISGIGNLVGGLFGGSTSGIKNMIENLIIMGSAGIDAKKVKENSEAALAFGLAMSAMGGGAIIGGIGSLVSTLADGIAGFFGQDPPLKKMEEFGKLEIGNPEKIKQNAEVFTAFGNAMSSFKGASGGIGGVLGDALAGFFKITPPIQQMKDFAKEDFGPLKDKIKNNAEAFTIFGNAMASYKGSGAGMLDVLAQATTKFLNVDTPFDKFQKFAAIEGIDVNRVKNNAEAFTAFGNAMAAYQGGGEEGFWSSLGAGISSFFGGGGKGDIISDFERFSKIDSAGITAVADATNLASEYISDLATAFDELANVDLKALTGLPWSKLIAFASAGGSVNLVRTGNRSFNITEDSAKNIKSINDTLGLKSGVLKTLNDSLKYQQQTARNTEATAEFVAKLIELTASGTADIVLDGKILNKEMGRITQQGRAVNTGGGGD